MKAVVLISGNGSNLAAIIAKQQQINLQIVCVISNNANAYGLKRAKKVGIKTKVISNRGNFDAELMTEINTHQAQLIILAGFMRILTTKFINKYLGKIINIHPSLLPKFKGLNTHKRAISAGEKIHGASVHFVTKELDSGAVIAQRSVPILATDTPEKLASKVLKEEHILYAEVISYFTQNRLKLENNIAYLDDKNNLPIITHIS